MHVLILEISIIFWQIKSSATIPVFWKYCISCKSLVWHSTITLSNQKAGQFIWRNLHAQRYYKYSAVHVIQTPGNLPNLFWSWICLSRISLILNATTAGQWTAHFHKLLWNLIFVIQDIKSWRPSGYTAVNQSKPVAVSMNGNAYNGSVRLANNRKLNVNELFTIFYFWSLNYRYNDELNGVNTMGPAGSIIICLN